MRVRTLHDADTGEQISIVDHLDVPFTCLQCLHRYPSVRSVLVEGYIFCWNCVLTRTSTGTAQRS